MPSSFVAILLGAHKWPRSPSVWPESSAFLESARAVREYLLDPKGLGLSQHDVLWLFDNDRAPNDIDFDIENFLVDSVSRLGGEVRDILVYYTGHGAFTERDGQYCLTVQSTRSSNLSVSAYRMSSLARTLNANASQARRYIIIDACFAAAGVMDFLEQSDNASRMERETMEVMPGTGTALLCAASAGSVALAPKGSKYTMFSGALLEVLREGAQGYPGRLSLDMIRDLTANRIRHQYLDRAVRPEIHIPDQRRGNISGYEIFPNVAGNDSRRANRERPYDWSLEELVNTHIVPETLIEYDYILAVADNLYRRADQETVFRLANTRLKEMDPKAILLQPGALVLRASSVEYWLSLIDEARRSGHRTVACVLDCLFEQLLPEDLENQTIAVLESVRKDFFKTREGL